MAPPFTFGIELEFAVACNITSAEKANATARSDGRVLEFVPLKQDYIDAEDSILAGIRTNEVGISADSRIAIRKIAHQVAIQRHIKRTLRKAGIPVARKKNSLYYKPNPAEWEIETDESVKGPENSEHAWVDIEAVSCIYEFNTQNVAEAKEVCNLIKSTYLTHTDHTAGMHVHVGQGSASFSFGEIQRLASFLFAFEPQLDSLHPRHRINTYYTSAMRKHAMFVPEWYVVHGEHPSASEGLAFLSRAKEPMPLFDAFCLGQGTEAKYSAYNFRGVRSLVKGDNGENAKPTVEFRQHEGTVDGDRVANWICLVVGIAKFLRDHETWERVYKSRFHSTSLRPAFAQDEFTVIDLLEYMGLDDQAEFYKTRLHQHLYTPPALRTGVSQKTKFTLAGGGEIDIRQAPRLLTQWWYAQDILDPDFVTNRKRQEVWEELKKLEIALTKDNPLDWDPEDPFWPPHRTLKLDCKKVSVIMRSMICVDQTGECESRRNRSFARADEDSFSEDSREPNPASESSGDSDRESQIGSVPEHLRTPEQSLRRARKSSPFDNLQNLPEEGAEGSSRYGEISFRYF